MVETDSTPPRSLIEWRVMKKLIITVILLGTVAALFLGCNNKPDGGHRNILLITLDTTRADRLGCYGYEKAKTPNMDALSREGVRFDMAIAQASVTPVSHASILTGLYPFQHGLRVIHGATNFRLDEDGPPTLASVLRKHGYATAAFLSAFTVSEYFGLQHGFDTFDTGIQGDVENKMWITETGRADWDADVNQRRADSTTDRAMAWLEEREDPFFMWIHFFDPHDMKLAPPDTYLAPYLENAKSLEEVLDRVYDAEVAYMDEQVGRVIDALKASGRFDDTLIIITNDHGQGLGDHDWWTHHILYQEQLRMPLIVRLPGGPEGSACSDLVRSIDIMPTVLGYARVESPPMAGKSLLGLMQGNTEPERIAYADALLRLDTNRPDEFANSRYDDQLYCVMTRDWKLIHHFYNPDASELFHLKEDPGEMRNVIYEFPEKRDELMKYLERPGIMVEKLIPATEDPEALERLKDLGY